jgi:leucine dehydrogenase
LALANVEELLKRWDGVAIVEAYDCTTEAWIWIAIHDDTLGQPVGGTRMKVYASPADGLRDAMRLAEGMTHKWVLAGGSFGGGKGVLALTRELTQPERKALLMRYGRLLGTMNGMFSTGPDLGTTPADMAELAKWSPHVHGVNLETGEAEDTSPYTAMGVFHGIRAAVEHLDGSDSLQGKSVLIQGVGNVGALLARLVADAGGRVLAQDLNENLAKSVAAATNGELVVGEKVYGTECDIYSPCAIGATVNHRTIPQLNCRMIVGGANNQLAEPADAVRLHERGILYAPDFVVNAGGAIGLGVLEHEHEDRRMQGVARIGDTLREILLDAAMDRISPLESALILVQKRLEAKRAERAG